MPVSPLSLQPRRDARAVEWVSLENCCTGNCTEGSNPSLSALACRSVSEGRLRRCCDIMKSGQAMADIVRQAGSK